MIVLGLHGGVSIRQHEPSAALVIDGKVVAVCEEERYLRVKSAYGYLPYYSIKACLDIANIQWEDIDLVVTPGVTYGDFEDRIRNYLIHNFGTCPRIERIHHQMAHIAAAFYGSGLEESLVLSLDASGDGASSMMGYASREKGIHISETIPTQRSLGMFYTMMTYYLGFGDGDEYKVMGLAPYGKPTVDLTKIITPIPGGWDFDVVGLSTQPEPRSPFEPTYAKKLVDLLGTPHRKPSDAMTPFYKDVARSTQAMFEQCLLALVQGLQKQYPAVPYLCYAGGAALNCAANKVLQEKTGLKHIYIPPMSSDRGLALGCAYQGAVLLGDSPWPLSSPYQGSSYSNAHIREELQSNGITFREVEDPTEAAATLLAEHKLLGWFQGRSEAGARALGNRSILANCESETMRDKVNAKIKYREEFRPFAPVVMFDKSETYFTTKGRDLPWMCFVVDAEEKKRDQMGAVVHVDGTARVQTVRSSNNELLYNTLDQYQHATGQAVLLNTSFNLKGQPIVETPRDAIMTFFGCGLDALIMGNFVVEKAGI